MLPKEIDALVDRMLPLIAKGDGKNPRYFFQVKSSLSSQEWQALNRRLHELGLANASMPGAIELNAQGLEVARTDSYQKFLKGFNARANDSLATNRLTRGYFWVALVGLIVAIIVGYINWLAYKQSNEPALPPRQVPANRLAQPKGTSGVPNHS